MMYSDMGNTIKPTSHSLLFRWVFNHRMAYLRRLIEIYTSYRSWQYRFTYYIQYSNENKISDNIFNIFYRKIVWQHKAVVSYKTTIQTKCSMFKRRTLLILVSYFIGATYFVSFRWLASQFIQVYGV